MTGSMYQALENFLPTLRANAREAEELRKVPDDPSGLLRARIRQHYVQLRSGAN